MRNWKRWSLLATVAGVAGLGWYWTNSSHAPALAPTGTAIVPSPSAPDAAAVPDSNGGKEAVASSPATGEQGKPSTSATPDWAEKHLNYGKTPGVKIDANEQVKSVVEAIKNKDHPERLSPLIEPKPFDLEAYKKDPKAYVNVVEPGRVFQNAQPGDGVPRLVAMSEQWQQVAQGSTVTLKVAAEPKMPVTFTSFDCGQFDNQLTSQTVVADEQGIAQVNFHGVSGTIQDVKILAGSPVSSGQIRFVVNVTMPQQASASQ
jgi:hypothetical protein